MNNLSLCTLPCCLPAFWSFLTGKIPPLPVVTIPLIMEAVPCLPPGLRVSLRFRLFPFFGDRLHLLIGHKRRPEIKYHFDTEYPHRCSPCLSTRHHPHKPTGDRPNDSRVRSVRYAS